MLAQAGCRPACRAGGWAADAEVCGVLMAVRPALGEEAPPDAESGRHLRQRRVWALCEAGCTCRSPTPTGALAPGQRAGWLSSRSPRGAVRFAQYGRNARYAWASADGVLSGRTFGGRSAGTKVAPGQQLH
jgi:hypothetical protein